jgi:hypothetical protein
MRVTAEKAIKRERYNKNGDKVLFEINHHELIDILTPLMEDVAREYGDDSEKTDLLLRELTNFHQCIKHYCISNGKAKNI